METDTNDRPERSPRLRHINGKLWFSRETERRICFILTLVMLASGILFKLGVL